MRVLRRLGELRFFGTGGIKHYECGGERISHSFQLTLPDRKTPARTAVCPIHGTAGWLQADFVILIRQTSDERVRQIIQSAKDNERQRVSR